jgi:hypothetical protein
LGEIKQQSILDKEEDKVEETGWYDLDGSDLVFFLTIWKELTTPVQIWIYLCSRMHKKIGSIVGTKTFTLLGAERA